MYWEEVSEAAWEEGILAKVNYNEDRTNIGIRIYFDMDGVLANWNYMKSPEHPDGVTMEDVFSKGYFLKLKPIMSNIMLVKELINRGIDVKIASKSKYFAIQEKWQWLQKYLPEIKKKDVYFIPLDKEKSDFVPEIKSTDILIDDYNANLYAWKGTSIKAVTNMNNINPDFKYISVFTNQQNNLNAITEVCKSLYEENKDNPAYKKFNKDISKLSNEDLTNERETEFTLM